VPQSIGDKFLTDVENGSLAYLSSSEHHGDKEYEEKPQDDKDKAENGFGFDAYGEVITITAHDVTGKP
jgi:hypothetical protein